MDDSDIPRVPLRTHSGLQPFLMFPEGSRVVRIREEDGRLLVELDVTDALPNPAPAGFSFGAK